MRGRLPEKPKRSDTAFFSFAETLPCFARHRFNFVEAGALTSQKLRFAPFSGSLNYLKGYLKTQPFSRKRMRSIADLPHYLSEKI